MQKYMCFLSDLVISIMYLSFQEKNFPKIGYLSITSKFYFWLANPRKLFDKLSAHIGETWEN